MSLNPYQEYQSNQISTAEPLQLIIMLYDGAIRFLDEAHEFISDFKTYDKANEKILRVQDILTELMLSLDMEKGGEISQNLFNLYSYMKKHILEANIEKDSSKLENVLRLLKELRAAWDSIDLKNNTNLDLQKTKSTDYQGRFLAQG